ncbi:hypothetical protein [Agromyces sp. NPDC058064]|uniref:hypothetical protein n=1 Tax=Agromyces sp. NPDC058064 TaxID=3346322 RepID=UPI0036DE7B25
MSDTLTYKIPTTTDVECDVCEAICTVTYWDDIRTGRWEREAFTCECGERHGAIDGSAEERGAASIAFLLVFSLFVIGLACALFGALGHSFPLFVGGIILAVSCWGVGAFTSKEN